LKAFALGLFFAALAFSYALATHTDSAASRSQVQPRSVDQTLRFTNPFLQPGQDPAYPLGGQLAEPQGFDLGDALLNKQFTRYVTATGGYLPYTFEARPNFDFVGTNQSPPLPKIFQNGRITDTFGTSILGAARFNVVVNDFLGTQRTGTFRLNLYSSPSSFRFAQNALPAAQLGNTYFTNLETLSASGAVTFSVSNIIANGAAVGRLEDIGLTLTSDGIIYGRPSIKTANAVSVTFTVHATDAAGNVALSRNGAKQDQDFTLPVEANSFTISEILALNTKLNINTDPSKPNQDSFSYIGFYDPKGLNTASLTGTPFTLRIGSSIFTGNFDASGKVTVPFSGKRSGLKVTVTPDKSIVQVSLTGANLSAALNTTGLSGKVNQNIVVMMEFTHYRACDPIPLTGRAGNNRVALQYSLGAKGHPLAGGFQVVSVIGADRKLFSGAKGDLGTPGDIWLVHWMGVPRFGIDMGANTALPVHDFKVTPQTATVSATIRIGDGFSQQFTAALKSNRLRFQATGKDPGLHQCVLDGNHFSHTLTTNVIVEGDTSIPQAINVKNATIFRFGMDVTGFSGQTGRVMIPNGFTWFAQ